MSDYSTYGSYYLFIGTYSPANKDGFFLYRFDAQTGRATFIQAVSGIENPSFLCLSPDHNHVYVVSETHKNKDGQVYAFRFDHQKEQLTFINKASTKGDDPCNITTDYSGKFAFVSNYSSGSLAVFSLAADGTISSSPIQLIQHEGQSINKERQDKAHVHCAIVTNDNRHLFVTDLGMDKVFCYLLDEGDGKLTPAKLPFTDMIPGSGPRLLAISSDGNFLYVLHELGGQITILQNRENILEQIEVVSNLPVNYEGKIWAGDLHITPDGKFLYATNRDDLNDIVTYRIHPRNGKLILLDRQTTGGQTPRNFSISPDGKHVLVGHRNSEDISVFERNLSTGALTLKNAPINVPHAVCLKMIAGRQVT